MEDNKINFEDYWHLHYANYPKNEDSANLLPVFSFNPNLKVIPSLMVQMVLGLNFPRNDSAYLIKVYEEGQLVLVPNELVGAGMMAITGVDMGRSVAFDISKKYIIRLKRKDYDCDEDNGQNLEKCIEEYAERNMDCYLPWREKQGKKLTHMYYTQIHMKSWDIPTDDKRICNTMEDTKRYSRLTARYQKTDVTLEEILEATGCRINCKYAVRLKPPFN